MTTELELQYWRAIDYYVRKYEKFLSYQSSAIFCTFYSLSVRKNCLTYVQPTTIVFYLQNVYFNGRLSVLVK